MKEVSTTSRTKGFWARAVPLHLVTFPRMSPRYPSLAQHFALHCAKASLFPGRLDPDTCLSGRAHYKSYLRTMALYGAVELGGTKTLVAVGTTPDDMAKPIRIPTEDPESTLSRVIDYLRQHPIEAVGISSFGPLELRRMHEAFGSITTTPKSGWSGTDVLGTLSRELDLQATIDTDVNAAALAEGRWGSAQDLNTFLYMTVGTGIGVGAVVEGRTLNGLGHPEMGHVVVRRRDGDDYAGRCPFHGDCLEGLACGPALEDRFGPAEGWGSDVCDLVVVYLAQGLRSIVYSLAPERTVVGGGVSKLPGFHAKLRTSLGSQLSGYPPIPEREAELFITPPLLEDSGLVGALILAEMAAS
jgi:fructokinase